MPLKSTFLAFKNSCTSCPNGGGGNLNKIQKNSSFFLRENFIVAADMVVVVVVDSAGSRGQLCYLCCCCCQKCFTGGKYAPLSIIVQLLSEDLNISYQLLK